MKADLESLLESTTRGDPEAALRWTCKSVRQLTAELKRMKHQTSHQVSLGLGRLTNIWELYSGSAVRKSGRMRNVVWTVLRCAICLRLWAEYGAATIELRARMVKPNQGAARARATGRLEDALKAMREHEAEAHHETRGMNQALDLARVYRRAAALNNPTLKHPHHIHRAADEMRLGLRCRT